ncbi:MAG TPA: rRNA maturation RNase YbeY [Caulobacteraceae bacterium]|jgi:probable rRNA maturation factor
MIEVEIEDEAWLADLPNAEAVAAQAAEIALQSAHPGGDLVTVLLTSDEAVRDLNARFRGKDAPTNVLSFPAPQSARPHLGDIALAYGVCAREAGDQGKPLAHHLAHLVAHGVLHLLGYDHEREEEAVEMEALERRILAGLGVPDPYEAAA